MCISSLCVIFCDAEEYHVLFLAWQLYFQYYSYSVQSVACRPPLSCINDWSEIFLPSIEIKWFSYCEHAGLNYEPTSFACVQQATSAGWQAAATGTIYRPTLPRVIHVSHSSMVIYMYPIFLWNSNGFKQNISVNVC